MNTLVLIQWESMNIKLLSHPIHPFGPFEISGIMGTKITVFAMTQ